MRRTSDRSVDPVGGMRGLSAGIAVGLLFSAVGAGCEKRAADPPAPAASTPPSAMRELASLPRDHLTLEQRAGWRPHLRWPDDCEQAFRASSVGADGGIRVVRLTAAVSLVEVTCAAGAYQPSTMRFRLTEEAGGARSTPLSFPVYTSENGRDLALAQETEVWGESIVNGPSAEVVILSLARQTADCGVWARYSLADDQPRLLAAAARTECPVAPGPAAQLSEAGPPEGWLAITRKD